MRATQHLDSRFVGPTLPVLLALALLSGGCVPDPDLAVGDQHKVNLGEEIFKIARSNLARVKHCAPQKVAVLDSHRTDLIDAINTTIDGEKLNLVRTGVSEAMVPMIKNGALPRMTDDLAGMLEVLLIDPKQQALGGIVDLASTQGVLDLDSWISLGGQLLEQQRISAFVAASSEVVRKYDGKDAKGNPVGSEEDLVRSMLTTLSSTLRNVRAQDNDLWSTLQDEGLATATVDPAAKLGRPAWSVWADLHGNPRVAVDPKTKKLFVPFVDRNGDGAADVNKENQPVDGAGKPITLPAFGHQGLRDADLLALHSSGAKFYDYFDVKRTTVGLGLGLAGDLFREGVHLDALPALQGALGPRQGTGASVGFNPDNPLADTAHYVVDVLALDSIPKLLDSWGKLVRARSTLAERIVIAFGKALSIYYKSGGSLAVPENVVLVRDLLPLLGKLFDQQGGKEATISELLDVLQKLGKTAPSAPSQIGATIRFAKIKKGSACSGGPIDEKASTPVDFSKGRYYSGVDNRSVLEKNIELLATADKCKVPLTGKTISELVLDTLADESPKTVCNLTNNVLKVAKIPGAKYLAVPALDLMGCDGKAVWSSLMSLDSMAKSGALDAYLPIANIFVKKGRTRQLLELFHVLRNDLILDEKSTSEHSALRAMLPSLAAVLKDDISTPMFDLLDALVTMKVDSTHTGADVLAELIADLLEQRTLTARDGSTHKEALASAVVIAWLRVVKRIEASSHKGSMDRLLQHFVELLSKTEPVPGGSAQLANRGLIPFAERLFVFATEMLKMTPAERASFVGQRRKELTDFLTSAELASLIHLWDLVHNSPAQREFDKSVTSLLTPASDPRQDSFGGLLRVAGGALQTKYKPKSVEYTALYLGDVLDPNRGRVDKLIVGLDDLLRHDKNDFVLQMARNLMSQGADGKSRAPLAVMVSVVEDVGSIDEGTCKPKAGLQVRVDLVAAALRSTVDFMLDRDRGLGAIYRLIHAQGNQTKQ
jgi:hypothetical protein